MKKQKTRNAQKRRQKRRLAHRTARKALAVRRRRLDLLGGPGADIEVRTVMEEGQRVTKVETVETLGEKWRRNLSRVFSRKPA